jgi:hypothetical protein
MRTTSRFIPEDGMIYNYCGEDLRSYKDSLSSDRASKRRPLQQKPATRNEELFCATILWEPKLGTFGEFEEGSSLLKSTDLLFQGAVKMKDIGLARGH